MYRDRHQDRHGRNVNSPIDNAGSRRRRRGRRRSTPHGDPCLPGPDAGPGSAITVTFDRPVAGSLDRSIDPRTVLALDPVMQGTFEWRDPVTLRFRPASPMPAGLRVRVTVAPAFPAMDGQPWPSRISSASGCAVPRVLAGLPAGHGVPARFLPPDARFQIVLSAPADPALLGRLVYLEMNRACPPPASSRSAPVTRLRFPRMRPGSSRRRADGSATAPPTRCAAW